MGARGRRNGRGASANGLIRLVSGRYPFVSDMAESFAVESVEFLDPSSDLYALRPADPLEVTFGFYSPAVSFCYPGGEGPLGSEHGS